MRVKVGDTWYTDEEQPLMVELSDFDKTNIRDMPSFATRYCSAPNTWPADMVKAWMGAA